MKNNNKKKSKLIRNNIYTKKNKMMKQNLKINFRNLINLKNHNWNSSNNNNKIKRKVRYNKKMKYKILKN